MLSSQIKNRTIFILGGIILFYLVNSIWYLQSQSITSDEGTFLNYAIRFLKGHPERIHPVSDNSKMPVSIINTIPRIIEQVLNKNLKKTDYGFSDIMMGRYVTLFVSINIILLVFSWSKQLYGTNSGLFAAFLYSLCPNNLSNASLFTTDSYSVFMLLLVMYLLWKWCKTKELKHFILLAISVAIAQIVKQSLFHLYLIIPITLLVYYFTKTINLKVKQVLIYIFIFAFINWLIISSVYFFNGINHTLGSYKFMSNLFQSVQQMLPSQLIVPLPQPFIDGLDMAKYYDQVGGGTKGLSSFGNVTILSKESTGGSFWYYYFVTLFYKTPIPYFLFLVFMVCLFYKSKIKYQFFTDEMFLLLPVFYFITILSFFYKTQCGIRHIIFIYPFLFIISSIIINHLQHKWAKLFVTISSVYLFVSVLFYWGNYYPYTNEFILNKKNAYKYVGAGNLEFLQGKYFAESYLKKHPEVQYILNTQTQGRFLINTADYLDIWNLHEYEWIKKYQPVGHVAFSWLLIDTNNQK